MMQTIEDFDLLESCPDCNQPTDAIKLGSEPAREVCGRFGCSWDGVTLE